MRDPDAIRLLNWKKPTERDVRALYTFQPFDHDFSLWARKHLEIFQLYYMKS